MSIESVNIAKLHKKPIKRQPILLFFDFFFFRKLYFKGVLVFSYQLLVIIIRNLKWWLEFYLGSKIWLFFQISPVRGQILLMDPLPTVRKAYSLVSQEEAQREIGSTKH